MSNRRARGFSLVELIVSLILSTFVLVGIISVATSMVRYQFESSKKGRVATHTLYSISQMNKQLEDATYLETPSQLSPLADVVRGCSNWTLTTPGGTRIDTELDPDGPGPLDKFSNVASFHYCAAPPGCGSGGIPTSNPPYEACTLWRYTPNAQGVACNLPVVPNCGAAVGGFTLTAIVHESFYRIDNNSSLEFFRRADEASGIEVRFQVGVATPTASFPTPAYYKLRTTISMNKSYNSVD